MNYEWDDRKRTGNLEKHGLDFIDAHELWSQPMVIAEDHRYSYGEHRFIALGLLKNRVVVCAYTNRWNETVRVISFRKANSREAKQYEQTIKNTQQNE